MSITRRPASGRVLAALSDTMRFLIYVVSTMPNSTRRASSPCPGSGTLAPTMTLSRRRVLAGIPTTLALAAAGRHAGAVVVPESTWRAEGMRPFISLAHQAQFSALVALSDDGGEGWNIASSTWIGNFGGVGHLLTAAHVYGGGGTADHYL